MIVNEISLIIQNIKLKEEKKKAANNMTDYQRHRELILGKRQRDAENFFLTAIS